MVYAVQKLRPYLIENHLLIMTDHQSLKISLEQMITTPSQQKWSRKLVGFDYEICYRRGEENRAIDAFSKQHDINVEGSILMALSVVTTNLF